MIRRPQRPTPTSPLFPYTTLFRSCFLLIALSAFARGSPRFHTWLYTHPRFGPPLQAWDRHGVIRPGAKVVAIVAMAASLAITIRVSSGPALPTLVGLVLSALAVFIMTRPSRAPAEG